MVGLNPKACDNHLKPGNIPCEEEASHYTPNGLAFCHRHYEHPLSLKDVVNGRLIHLAKNTKYNDVAALLNEVNAVSGILTRILKGRTG